MVNNIDTKNCTCKEGEWCKECVPKEIGRSDSIAGDKKSHYACDEAGAPWCQQCHSKDPVSGTEEKDKVLKDLLELHGIGSEGVAFILSVIKSERAKAKVEVIEAIENLEIMEDDDWDEEDSSPAQVIKDMEYQDHRNTLRVDLRKELSKLKEERTSL